MNELQPTQEKNEISLFAPEQFNHYFDIATKMSKTSMVPKSYIGKPMEILIAMEYGMSLGLGMLQSIQEIAIINGKPALYGDGFLAVCQGHHSFEDLIETAILADDGSVAGYTCIAKRKNRGDKESVFTIENAKKARLWGGIGSWSQYPERMLKMRARGFALRDQFADILRGVKSVEEVQDYPIKDVTPKNAAQDIVANLISANHVPDAKQKVDHIVEVNEMVTAGQTEHILKLFKENKVSDARRIKALAMYNCNEISELELKQADELICILEKGV